MLKYEVFTNLFQSLGQEDNVSNEINELSESQYKWRWVMIVLLISFEQIFDFSHVVNCIVRARLHIKTCYVVGEFSQISYFFGGDAGGVQTEWKWEGLWQCNLLSIPNFLH